MNTFRPHRPRWIDGKKPTNISFDTVDDLLNIQIMHTIQNEQGFDKFVLSDNLILGLFNDGFRWVVVGSIRSPNQLFEPWEGGKYHAVLGDGTKTTLTGSEVLSSCGDILTLRDGTTATKIPEQ